MTKKTTLQNGKLDAKFLSKLIAKLPTCGKNIIVPPGIGLDAAGLKIGNKLIAITIDPITFSTENIGTYSVAVNINDVACLGCQPKYFLGCLLLPSGITAKKVEHIWNNLAQELKRYDVLAIGGHVEVTSTVNTPIIVGQMIGEAISNKLLTPQNGKPGDQILLWRNIAIEGTALLATERADYLKKFLPIKKIKAMQNLLHNPGICIWPLAKKIIGTPGLVALHDITEGGIATAIHELADAAKCGFKINKNSIAILEETKTLCDIFKINPLGLLASGSLLVLCKKNAVKKLLAKVNDSSLQIIGELTKSKNKALPRFTADEIVKALNL